MLINTETSQISPTPHPSAPLSPLSFLPIDFSLQIPKVILSAPGTCKWHLKALNSPGSPRTSAAQTHSAEFLLMEIITPLQDLLGFFLSPRGAPPNCLPLYHLGCREETFNIQFVLNKLFKGIHNQKTRLKTLNSTECCPCFTCGSSESPNIHDLVHDLDLSLRSEQR